MLVTTQPGSATGGIDLNIQPAVTLYGAEGHPCYGDNTTIVFAALQVNPAVFATLRMHDGAQSSVTAGDGPRATTSNGTATFDGLYVNENATGYTLLFVATSHGLHVESQTFQVNIGIPHQIVLHRDHASGVLWAHQPTTTGGELFTATGTGGLPLNPPPRLSLVDLGGNVVINPKYSSGVRAEMTLKKWPVKQKYYVHDGNVWSLGINSAGITELQGSVVTQGSSTGTLSTSLSNRWRLEFSSVVGLTEEVGAIVRQGSSSGNLTKSVSNTWALNVQSWSPGSDVHLSAGTVVTQLGKEIEWTLGINSATLTMIAGTAAKQGKIWTLGMAARSMTESVGVVVTQSNAHRLWTITLSAPLLATHAVGSTVTQSTSSGTLFVAIDASSPAIVLIVRCDTSTTFDTSSILMLGGTTNVPMPSSATFALVPDAAGVLRSGPLENVWTLRTHAPVLLTETATSIVTQGGSQGTLKIGEGHFWRMRVKESAAALVTESQGVAVKQGATWTMAIGSTGISESVGAVVTQGSSSGTLASSLSNFWEISFASPLGLSLLSGTKVVQGSSEGTVDVVQTSGPSGKIWGVELSEVGSYGELLGAAVKQGLQWTLDISPHIVHEIEGVEVTQISRVASGPQSTSEVFAKGILRFNCTGETEKIVILSDPGIVFDASSELLVGTTTINAVDILASSFQWDATGTLETALSDSLTEIVPITTKKISLEGTSIEDIFVPNLPLLIGSTIISAETILRTNQWSHENVWTLSFNSAIGVLAHQPAGVSVIQGASTGILSARVETGLSNSIIVTAASGVTFDAVTNIVVGGITVQGSSIASATNTGASTLLRILCGSGVSFDSLTNILVGGGSSVSGGTTIVASSLASASNAGAVTSVVVLSNIGVTFTSSTFMRVGEKVVGSSDITSATSGWLAEGVLVDAMENVWSLTTKDSVSRIREMAGVTVTQAGGATGLLRDNIWNVWNVTIAGGVVAETSGVTVYQGRRWTLTTTSVGIDETEGVSVTQSNGFVMTTIGLSSPGIGITETSGVDVKRGGVLVGTLVSSLENVWTLALATPSTIDELQGVTVVQGSSMGTLKTALSTGMTTIVITAASGVSFDSSTDLTIGTTPLLATAVTTSTNTGATTFVVVRTMTGDLVTTLDNATDLIVGTTLVSSSAMTTIVATTTQHATGKLSTALRNKWTASLSPTVVLNHNVGDLVMQGAKWIVSLRSQGITEVQGAPVTQGSSAGTLTSALVNKWTMDMQPTSLTVVASSVVSQRGMYLGTLVSSLENVWTLALSTSSTIDELQGVTVVQGSSMGTLKTALSTGMTTIVITAASGVSFDSSTDLTIGTTPLLATAVTTATNTGATTSLLIATESDVTFDIHQDLVVGATTVPSSKLVSATNTGATTEFTITTEPGVLFDANQPIVVGGKIGATTVQESNLIDVSLRWDAVGELVSTYTGTRSTLEFFASSGTIFDTSSSLAIAGTLIYAGSAPVPTTTIIPTISLSTVTNTGGTTSISVSSSSDVVFDAMTDLIVGTTSVAGSILQTATPSWDSTGVLQTTLSASSATEQHVLIDAQSGISFSLASDLVVGATTISAVSVTTIIGTKAASIVVNCASGVSFDALSDVTVGSTLISSSDIVTASSTAATTTTSVHIAATSGSTFTTNGGPLLIGTSQLDSDKIATAVNTDTTDVLVLTAASGVTFDATTDITIGATSIPSSNLASADNTGATTSLTILTEPDVIFDTGTNLQVGTTLITHAHLSTVSDGWEAEGVLRDQLTGAGTTTIVVTANSGVSFDATRSLSLGAVSSAITVTAANVLTAASTQSTAVGQLAEDLSVLMGGGGAAGYIHLNAMSGAEFHGSSDLIMNPGSSAIVVSSSSIGSTNHTGGVQFIMIETNTGVTFNANADLTLDSPGGSSAYTLPSSSVLSVSNVGATETVEVLADEGVSFDTTTSLLVGSTSISATDVLSVSSTEHLPILTDRNGSRIGVLSGGGSNSPRSFQSGTATFRGVSIDVAGVGYLLSFRVYNLTSAFPDYVHLEYRTPSCDQPVLTTREDCERINVWTPEVAAYCSIKKQLVNDGVVADSLTESDCPTFGGTWIQKMNATCSQPILTEQDASNCTRINTWDQGQKEIVASVFGVPAATHNYTLTIGADIGVGKANTTLVKSFPYGSISGGEALHPTVEIWLVDAGLNRIDSDNVSKCTVFLSTSPFNGREEFPGYGVARIGVELQPPILPFPHSYLGDGNQSLTVDFHMGVAKFPGLNVSHVGGPYTLSFNASSQSATRASPNGWNGHVIGSTKPFYVDEGKPRRLEVLRRPSMDVAGRMPLEPQPVIALVDAGGNIVRSESSHYVMVELVSTTHPDGIESNGGVVLLGIKEIKLEGGIARFENLALEDPAQEYVLRFTTTMEYNVPRYAIPDATPMSVDISVACRYSAVKTIVHDDAQPNDGLGYSVDTETNFDVAAGESGGRMLLVSGAPFEDRPIEEIQTIRTRAGSIKYVDEIQEITTSVLHQKEMQIVETRAPAGTSIRTTVVQDGDRIDLVPTFRLRWKHAPNPLSNFVVFGVDTPYYPNTETRDLPWNILPDSLATYLMEDLSDLGIGNVDVTRTSNDESCQCIGAFSWTVTFRDLRGPVPLLESFDSGFSSLVPSGTIVTSRKQQSPSLSGHFTLSLPLVMHQGHIGPIQQALTTRPILFNASAEDMRIILSEDLWPHTDIKVSAAGPLFVPSTYYTGATKINVVDFSRVWTVTFKAEEMFYAVPQLLPSSAGLEGHGARVVVATYEEGAAPVGGHFALGFRHHGNVGRPVRWNATSAEVKSALEDLHSVYTVDVARSEPMGLDRSYEWTVTFIRVADFRRQRMEEHDQNDLKSPSFADEYYQRYSWSDWYDHNGNLPPLETNSSYTSGTDVVVEIGAVYDMERMKEQDHFDKDSWGPSMRSQILNNIGGDMVTGMYKNHGGASRSSARMGNYGPDAGAAYVFTRNGSHHRWSQRIKLRSIDTTETDHFGRSVSASRTAVLVGAPGANDDGLIEQKSFRCVADGGNFRLMFKSRGGNQTVKSKQYMRTTNQGPAPHLEMQPEEGYGEEDVPTTSMTRALWAGTLTVKQLEEAMSEAWSIGRVVIRRRITSGLDAGTGVDATFESQLLTNPKETSLNKNSTENGAFLNTKVCRNGSVASPFLDLVVFFHSRTREDLPSMSAEPSPMHMYPMIVNGTSEKARVHVVDLVQGTGERLSMGAAHVFRWDKRASAGLTERDVWYEEAKLMAPKEMSQTGDQFGWQVELEGGTAIVSAPNDQHRGPASGAIYVFKRNFPFAHSTDAHSTPGESIGSRRRVAQAIDSPEWSFKQRLTSQDFACGTNSDQLRPLDCPESKKMFTGRRFGASMTFFDGTLVVAERPKDPRWGTSRVVVYRRLREEDVFQPSQIISDPFINEGEGRLGLSSMFGFSLAVDKDTLAVGAPGRGTPGGKGVVLLYKRTAGELNFPLVYESRVEAGIGAVEGDGFGSQLVLDICSEAEANPSTTSGNDVLLVASHPQGVALPGLRPRKLIQSITTSSSDGGILSGHFYVTRSCRRRTSVESEFDLSLSPNLSVLQIGTHVEVRRSGNAGLRYYPAIVVHAPNHRRPNSYADGGLGSSMIVDDTYAVRYEDTGVLETNIVRRRIRAVDTLRDSREAGRTKTEEYVPLHTRRLLHDVSASSLVKILAEDLGMYGARVERRGPDLTGGYIWIVTHQSEYGETPIKLAARTSGALVSSIGGTVVAPGSAHGRSAGGTTVVVKTLNKPASLHRRGISVFFRERIRFMADGADTWVKHGVMRPLAEEGRYDARGTELMGASPSSSMSMSEGIVAVGAPNTDSHLSGNNAGSVFVFDLSLFNLAFDVPGVVEGAPAAGTNYVVSEDAGFVTIGVRRCGLGVLQDGCRVKSLQNTNPLLLLQHAEYIVGDGAGSRVPGATEDDLLLHSSRDYAGRNCPNPNGGCASTATGRAECLHRTRYGKAVFDCLWIPGDSKVYQPSSYDFGATSDYVPDWQVFSMDPSNGTSRLFRFDVVVTNDHTREYPDESINLRLSVPGIEPIWNGSLWTTVLIRDDGDGGVGLSSYYEIMAADEPEPIRGRDAPRCVGDATHVIDHAFATKDDTRRQSVKCATQTTRVFCHEIPGCSWLEGAAPGALNDTNVPLSPLFDAMRHDNNRSRFNAFGSSVAVDRIRGDLAVVAAPSTDVDGKSEVGAVYVYHKSTAHGVWERVHVLVAPDPWFRSGTRFGRSIAISNGTLVVGADHHYPSMRDEGKNSHRTYVFELGGSGGGGGMRVGTEWTHVANLTWPLDHSFADASGTSFGGKNGVAVSGSWIVVAALGEEAIFLFQRCDDGGACPSNDDGSVQRWIPRQRIRRPNHNERMLDGADLNPNADATMHQRALARAKYGASVALWNDTLVVGCPDDEYELTDPLDGPIETEGGGVNGGVNWMREDKSFRGRGSVFVYLVDRGREMSGSNESWLLQETLRPNDVSQRDRYGESVDVNFDYIVVGSPGDTSRERTTWDFETGNLVGWHKTGDAFDFQPTLGDNTNARSVYGWVADAGTDVHEKKVDLEDYRFHHTPEVESDMEYTLREYVAQRAYYGDRGQESNKQQRYWIGTYENRSHSNATLGTAQGDVPQGTLTSDPFVIGGSEMSFLIGGGCEKEYVRVELIVDGEQFVFAHPDAPFRSDRLRKDVRASTVLQATGECHEAMTRVVWDVSDWRGRTAQLRLVDQSSEKWGHINVDDVRFGWGSKDGTHGGVSGDGNITCSSGQCGDQQGLDAGAAYLWRRTRIITTKDGNVNVGRDGGVLSSDPVIARERCEQYCNTHGCFLVNVPGQFHGMPASPEYTGDEYTHRAAMGVNRWNCEWSMVTKMLASDRRSGDSFGADVSVNGYTGIVAVGAPGSRIVDYLNRDFVQAERRGDLIPGYGYVPSRSGAVYVYAMEEEERSSQGVLLKEETWNVTEHAKLQPPQKMEGDLFGTSVAIDESFHVISGAPRTPSSFESNTPEQGLTYSYDVEFLQLRFKQIYVSIREYAYSNGNQRYDFSDNFVEFELVRSGELSRPLSVGYATSDITAIGTSSADADLCFSYPSDMRGECGDYVQTSGVATFEPGVALVHLRVYIMDDFCPEPTEFFRLQLYVPGGDVIIGPDFSVTVEINDDDGVEKSNWKMPSVQHFSNGKQNNLNCVRRVGERAYYETFQEEKDRVIPWLHRPEEKAEFMRSMGSAVASKKYMARDDRGFYNDGSPRDTHMYQTGGVGGGFGMGKK